MKYFWGIVIGLVIGIYIGFYACVNKVIQIEGAA